ncbi:glycosyltransferase [Enterovibrio sp. 27052020O]|uniref:glycosyltransferase n=1 Tax=Enterovibrio sp. 27052020O TaxID=3241166 RepID=UPI00388F4764
MSVKQPLHICHFVGSLTDTVLNDQVFTNIRAFPHPYFEHTLVVLKKSKIPSTGTIPNHVSCLELDLNGLLPSKLRQCHKALLALKPNICQTYGDQTFPIQWVAHKRNIPVKLHFYQNPTGKRGGFRSWFRQWMHRTLSYSSDFVIAQSEADKAWLTHVANISPERLKLIRSGINSRQCCPSLKAIDPNVTNHFVGTVPVPAHRFVVGVDVAGQSKASLEVLFDEYFAACMRSPTFRLQTLLLVAGNNPHLNQLRRALKNQYAAEEQVRFCGRLKDKHHFHSHIDTFVCLRPQHSDASVLEAMSMGLPIASNRIGNDCHDDDHPICWTTESGSELLQDQLLDLFSDNNKRLKIGRASRRYIQDFHNQHTYHTRFNTLYEMAKSTSIAEGTASTQRQRPHPTQFNR